MSASACYQQLRIVVATICFSVLEAGKLLDGNGECGGVDGSAACRGDGEGVGSCGGIQGLWTGGNAIAAGAAATDEGDQADKETESEEQRVSANKVARPNVGAPYLSTAGRD